MVRTDNTALKHGDTMATQRTAVTKLITAVARTVLTIASTDRMKTGAMIAVLVSKRNGAGIRLMVKNQPTDQPVVTMARIITVASQDTMLSKHMVPVVTKTTEATETMVVSLVQFLSNQAVNCSYFVIKPANEGFNTLATKTRLISFLAQLVFKNQEFKVLISQRLIQMKTNVCALFFICSLSQDGIRPAMAATTDLTDRTVVTVVTTVTNISANTTNATNHKDKKKHIVDHIQ